MYNKIDKETMTAPAPPLWVKLLIVAAVILIVAAVALVIYCPFHCGLS